MNTNLQTEAVARYFGARAVGVILLALLVSYIAADYVLVTLLEYLQEAVGIFSSEHSTETRIAAMRMAVSGVLNPLLTLAVTMFVLRTYFPKESARLLFRRFGFIGRPSKVFLGASFASGVAYCLFFSMVLANVFPPDQVLTPHPTNVINYASFPEKLLFAFTAITIVPITEEFLFRGVMYDGIAYSWGKWISAICVSSIFVIFHPDSIESGYWVTHLSLYIFPFFMVLLREKSGALFGSAMAHSGFNFAEIFF